MRKLVSVTLLVTLGWAMGGQSPATAPASRDGVRHLAVTPQTVAWGYYDAAAKPVLRIASGDTVEVETVLTNSPTGLMQAGLPIEKVEQSLRAVYSEVKDKGPGGHILTGPIYVEGAEPGDVLEVRIKAVKLALDYAYNSFGPRYGFLPEDFARPRTKIIPLDREKMVAHFAEGIEIPLRPFFGSMGVAPEPAAGRISSVQPGTHAGNLDNKELVTGRRCSYRCTPGGRCSRWATGTRGRGTVRWTSRVWRRRWWGRCNLWCGRT